MPAYKRPSSLMPMTTGYCPGCMHALGTRLVADAIDELNQQQNAINVVSVGCSALNLYSWNGDDIGAAHGRAPAVATGIKRCLPDRLVFTYRVTATLQLSVLQKLCLQQTEAKTSQLFSLTTRPTV